MNQRQDSLVSQIETVKAYFRRETPVDRAVSSDPRDWTRIATMLGCYDAADHFAKQSSVDWTKV